MNDQDVQRWTGRQVLIALLLFFGVVMAVNAAMVWIALKTWPGRSVRDAAREGRVPVVALSVAHAPRGRNVTWTG